MKHILFDLDGTLLPMDLDVFVKGYLGCIHTFYEEKQRDEKKIVDGVLYGTKYMMQNDGSQSNAEVFWKAFSKATGIEREDIIGEFNVFYETEFLRVEQFVSQSPNMIKAVQTLKDKGYKLYVTTNPLFPAQAVERRIEWSGLDIEDFETFTHYENSSFTKSSISYYKEFLKKQGLNPSECLMVGNNTIEDGMVESLGVPVYIVEDYLIHESEEDIQTSYRGSSEDFLKFVQQLDEV